MSHPRGTKARRHRSSSPDTWRQRSVRRTYQKRVDTRSRCPRLMSHPLETTVAAPGADGRGTARSTGRWARPSPSARCCSGPRHPAHWPGQWLGHLRPEARRDRRSHHRGAHVPLHHLSSDQGRYYVYDSMLSEFAALGFEYGYSVQNPETSCCGRPSSATSPMAPRPSPTSSSPAAEGRSGADVGHRHAAPHGYEGQGPTTPRHGSSGTCNCPRRTT